MGPLLSIVLVRLLHLGDTKPEAFLDNEHTKEILFISKGRKNNSDSDDF